MKKHVVRIVIGLAIVVAFLGHALDHYRILALDTFEAIIYDARLRLTMPRTVDNRVVILDIDEKSLLEREKGGEGRWPWPRDRLALMLDKLFDQYGIAVVGFDVVFAERDESSGIRVLERLAERELKAVTGFLPVLEKLKPQLNYDAIFAARMKGRNVVLGYTFSSDLPEVAPKKGMLPVSVLAPETFKGRNIGITSWNGYTANLEELQKAAASAGHFNPWTDDDGITRRVPMLAEYNGAYYEPLSLAVVRALLGFPPIKPDFLTQGISKDYAGLEELQVGPLRIPVDERVSTLVPYRGHRGSFKYISIVDILNDRVDIAELKGKIALVGTTAPGLLDLRATPVDSVYPGVEVHANLIAGILDQNIKHKPPYAAGAEFALLLLAGLVMTLLLPFVSPFKGTLTALLVLLAIVGINLALFQSGHLVLPLAAGIAMILLLFTFNMAYGFFVEARGKRQITGLFGQYVPPELVDEMAKDPEKFSMEGESREMTVLFTDVRGFTTISEGLDPKALSRLMNEFLTPLTEVIYRHRGTIDKYMGDCIMAFWGAPLADPMHARNGILAALEMQRTLKDLQPHFKANNWPEIHIGVGLNTGRMSVGNMGSRIRLAYTVMGDAVNLASRLEGITKEYGTDIIVGEDTRAALSDIVFRELDRVRVKGKDVAVAIFEPVGLQGEVGQAKLDELELFHRALKLYRSQNWDMAEMQLINLQKISPKARLWQTFLERIAFLRANPPGPDWDGAFTFVTK
ncbi:MAG: adenylate/guanylate cyclase domain-containing protein [Betaproteobacteria bacterium]|nr:adenylate/guanylate cyclase domain-containing protein [Betaproteobacteria bacterium]